MLTAPTRKRASDCASVPLINSRPHEHTPYLLREIAMQELAGALVRFEVRGTEESAELVAVCDNRPQHLLKRGTRAEMLRVRREKVQPLYYFILGKLMAELVGKVNAAESGGMVQ